jgi:hypothetical protein
MEMSPSTFVWNISSMSASAIAPTCSRPLTNPALLTARSDQLAALTHAGARTEDVDRAQLGRDALEQARDLRLVADVELDRRDLAAGADLGRCVRGRARVRDLLQRVLPAREQHQVRAGLGAQSQNMHG